MNASSIQNYVPHKITEMNIIIISRFAEHIVESVLKKKLRSFSVTSYDKMVLYFYSTTSFQIRREVPQGHQKRQLYILQFHK